MGPKIAYFVWIFLVGQCGIKIDVPYRTFEKCEANAAAQMEAYHRSGHIGGYAHCFPGMRNLDNEWFAGE